jgi:hypothetical protein
VVITVSARRIVSLGGRLGPQKYSLVALGAFTGALASPQNPGGAASSATLEGGCTCIAAAVQLPPCLLP